MTAFNYQTAFSRNIGWVTQAEQDVIRNSRVAIAGLGGVGGSHLITLARMGIGKFNISDMDYFDLVNFNRQRGAQMSAIGQPKIDVMADAALGINPDADIVKFADGISSENLDEFLDGVDIYVDSLDFFAVEARRAVFAACEKKGIPAVTAAPLGMGAAFLCFLPGQMTFEEYFRMEGQPEPEQLLRFVMGLAPARLQLKYLVEKDAVNFKDQRGPSTGIACEICAGIAGANVVKILLKRGDVIAAPRGLHFDAYTNRMKKTWIPWGNGNPLQKLKMVVARKIVGI